MNSRSKFAYAVAGFVGGVAFLISCSGGSGGDSGSSLINDADAAVAANQMVCEGAQSLWNGTSSGIPNIGPFLVCYDTSGTGRTISIADAYAEGWRVQLFTVVGSQVKYIFEQ